MLKEYFRGTGFKFTEETTRAEFDAALKDLQKYCVLLEYQKGYIYSYFHYKVISKSKPKVKDSKTQAKHKKAFLKFI
jgi:hypothetical protein